MQVFPLFPLFGTQANWDGLKQALLQHFSPEEQRQFWLGLDWSGVQVNWDLSKHWFTSCVAPDGVQTQHPVEDGHVPVPHGIVVQ